MQTELEEKLINFLYLLTDDLAIMEDGWFVRDKIMDFMEDNEL